MRPLTIGKAAHKAGVGVETIRFYERKGLIERPRKPVAGGFRVYPTETIGRIRFIRQAQLLGFTLREAGELLSLRADPDAGAADVRAQATAKLKDVEDRIRRLRQIRDALNELIATCPGQGALPGCSILDALERATDRCTQQKPKKKERAA